MLGHPRGLSEEYLSGESPKKFNRMAYTFMAIEFSEDLAGAILGPRVLRRHVVCGQLPRLPPCSAGQAEPRHQGR